MKLLTFVLCAMSLVVSTSGSVLAANEITVVVTGTGTNRPFSVTFDADEAINASNGLPTIASTDTRVNIYSTSTLSNAGRVTFVADTRSTDFYVFLGIGSFPTQQSDLPNAVNNWAGIASLPTELVDKVHLAGRVQGNLTPPSGASSSLSVGEIFDLEVGGQVTGSVVATGSGTAIMQLEFGSSTSAGTVTAANGSIDTINALSTTATISGAISAANGAI